VHYRNSDVEAQALCHELNQLRENSAYPIQADLCDAESVSKISDKVFQFGQLDALINNASSFYPTPFGSVTEKQWQDLHTSNLRAAFFLTQAVTPLLQQTKGAVVNIVDSHAGQSLKGFPAYSIAKTGLLAMTKSLAKELAPRVRVNSVSPGAMLWPEANEPSEAEQQRILRNIRLGRIGAAEDIAITVAFLILKASYMTGTDIRVDGGRGLN